MSIATRNNSAPCKRAEQLKRWEESDTNREPVSPKQKSRKIKFSSGCVFLAACAAGDKDEVLKLLEKGADINTANVDGLTALHQACIDDNLDMVEFLVEHGADVNRGDNEGWTPLHATASCGFLYIAKYLIEKGANVAAVNNDGELAIDIAECQKMEELLKEEIHKRGIDCDLARSEEERIMLEHAKDWFATKSSLVNAPNPKDGATPLHVASAKGYTDVIKVLLQCGADLDAQDMDGWTALHAASHWGQKEVCQLLAENLADMDSKNYVGQTVFDLADNDDFRYFLEDLKKKQNKEELNRRQSKKRLEIQDRLVEAETPSKVKKVELEITEPPKNKIIENIDMDVSSESETETESSSTESNSTDDEEKKNRVNSLISTDTNITKEKPSDLSRLPPAVPAKPVEPDDNVPAWRRQRPNKPDLPSPTKTTASFRDKNDVNNESEVTLRRTNSFQSDQEFYSKYAALHARIKANNEAPLNSQFPRPNSDSILASSNTLRNSSKEDENCATGGTMTSSKVRPVTTPTSQSNQPVRRSFVPPVRDEESETQRKAHAKRVRETRRSTQGVTLEEIKSAEQFVKNSTAEQSGPNNNNQGDPSNGVSVTATITTATPTVITPRESEESTSVVPERRPSWRLKVDNGSCKFKLEDATKPAEPPSTPSFVRRATNNSNPRPSSAPIETADTTVTLPLRRPKSLEEKEQDKENDIRNAQGTLATQAAIQRRRRPKRRSTGVVNFDNVDDPEQEKDPAIGGDSEDSLKLNNQESGNERSTRSRLGSSADIRNENGEIDYKKLYEEAMIENERLKDKLRKTEEELRDTKQTLEKINVVTSKNSISELEKREKRAMERKLSEMEEELKHLETLKTENQRLKDENGALIRVISKLSK